MATSVANFEKERVPRWMWPWKRKQPEPEKLPEGVRAFNLLAVWLLDKLYQSFPKPIDINVLHEIISIVVDELAKNPGTGDQINHPQYLHDTLLWLQKEGFIRWKAQSLDNIFFGVELTAQAFAVLQKTPSSITRRERESRKTFGTMLHEAILKQSADSIVGVGKLLFTTAILGQAAQ